MVYLIRMSRRARLHTEFGRCRDVDPPDRAPERAATATGQASLEDFEDLLAGHWSLVIVCLVLAHFESSRI